MNRRQILVFPSLGRARPADRLMAGCVFFFVLITCSELRAEYLPVPDLPEREQYGYRCTKLETGHEIYTLNMINESRREEGRDFFDVKQVWSWKDGRRTEYDARLEATDHLTWISAFRLEQDAKGRTLIREKMSVPEEICMPGMPPDLYYYATIFFIHRGQISHKDERMAYHVLYPGEGMLRILSRVRKEETVTVPAGTYVCYPISLVPDMRFFFGVMGRIIRLFANYAMPENTLWFSVEWPHFLVKYEGLCLGEPIFYPIRWELTRNPWHMP